ncbi:TonB-dependent receptor plug domain-containing protein [Marinomonas sp. RS-M-Aa-14]|uniref:TonB-dependent receptor plug domain-containing protein n=1 Tax=Marinomonas sp. RS-M-Aa-14 TaxID=3241169 RepID=UPI003AB0166B
MRGFFLSLNMPASAETDNFLLATELSDETVYESFIDSIPVVVTPSKMPQPRVDVSSSLSVLDGEFIRRVNMQYVEDLLQFVPGFSVVPYKTSSQKVASYHGTQLDQYRRIQVLVNGRSVYSTGTRAGGMGNLAIEYRRCCSGRG